MAVLSRPVVPASTRTPLLVLLATLLLLRSRLFSGPRELLSKLKAVTRGKRLTPEELAQVLEQVYVKQPDGSKLLLVPVKDTYVSEVRLFGNYSTFVWHFKSPRAYAPIDIMCFFSGYLLSLFHSTSLEQNTLSSGFNELRSHSEYHLISTLPHDLHECALDDVVWCSSFVTFDIVTVTRLSVLGNWGAVNQHYRSTVHQLSFFSTTL
jgi:hypothetical protein